MKSPSAPMERCRATAVKQTGLRGASAGEPLTSRQKSAGWGRGQTPKISDADRLLMWRRRGDFLAPHYAHFQTAPTTRRWPAASAGSDRGNLRVVQPFRGKVD